MTNVTVVLYYLILTPVASDNVHGSKAVIHLIQKKTRGDIIACPSINLRIIAFVFLAVFLNKLTIHMIGSFCFIETLTSS